MSAKPPFSWSASSSNSTPKPTPKHKTSDPHLLTYRELADRRTAGQRETEYSLELLGARYGRQATSEVELQKSLRDYLYGNDGSRVKGEKGAENLIRTAFEGFSETKQIHDPDYVWFMTSLLLEEYKQRKGIYTLSLNKEFTQQYIERQNNYKRWKAQEFKLHRARDTISSQYRNSPLPNIQLPQPSDPLRYIRQKRPDIYEKALKAFSDYQDVVKFEPYYRKLRNAASATGLTLDDQGELRLTYPYDAHDKFLDLFDNDTFKRTVDELITELEKNYFRTSEKSVWASRSEILLGEDFDFLLGIFEELRNIHTQTKNEQLVGKESEEKRFRKKISLLMNYKAVDLARQPPPDIILSCNESYCWRFWLYDQYQMFESRYDRWEEYEAIENSLDPNTKYYDSFRR